MARLRIGRYPGHLVKLKREPYTQPWVYGFQMTNRPRNAVWDLNVIDMFGGELILASIELRECDPWRSFDVIAVEVGRCLELHSPKGPETVAIQSYIDGFKDETPGTDLKIGAEERYFNVKMNVMANASPVFAQLFESSGFLENQTRVYTFTDHSADDVEVFLVYCYTGKVERTRLQQCASDLARMAHMYQVPNLLKLCELAMIVRAPSCMPPFSDAIGVQLIETGVCLTLELFLVALHMLQKERCDTSTKAASWYGLLARYPNFAEEMHKALEVR